jgi:hypothetical protein
LRDGVTWLKTESALFFFHRSRYFGSRADSNKFRMEYNTGYRSVYHRLIDWLFAIDLLFPLIPLNWFCPGMMDSARGRRRRKCRPLKISAVNEYGPT